MGIKGNSKLKELIASYGIKDMRYTGLRGLAKLKTQVLLTFACMNLKKLASWKRKNGLFLTFLLFMLGNKQFRKFQLNFT